MFQIFDVIVSIIVILTSVMAFMRGGARDLFSLLTWLISGAITIYFYPFLFAQTQEHFVSPTTASLVAIIPFFILLLIVFSIISSTILGNMIGFKSGVLDRFFGAAIGFIKGLAIVSTIHFCITLVADKEPQWLQDGQTYQFTHYGAQIVKDLTADILSNENYITNEYNPDNLMNAINDSKEQINAGIENIENIQMDAFEEEFIDEEIIDE